MSRASVRLCVLLIAVLAVCATDPAANDFPIKNVIVLMMENRSFDHMLGFLKQTNPNINGLNGDEYNPYNTTDPDSARVTVTSNALYVDPDPDHSLTGTAEQVFGGEGHWVDPAPMNGFVQNAVHTIGQDPEAVMQCFNYSTVPIITTLAQEFALCDSCYASVPGPTEVNRMFVHSATSNGTASNPKILGLIEGFPQKSIYKMLQENGISWGVYYQLISTTLLMRDVRSLDMLLHQHPLEQFFTDAAAGKLPQYSFVDPRYYPFLGQPANDQHPSHSVLEGERLMKQVYEAVRASPQWNETLLVITYDEHGGFYDHQPTPLHGVPNPDGLNSHKPAFNFTRLGVRIPTLFISPWVNKGAVIHDPVGPTPTSKREHSSVPATLKKIFNLPNFLTKRDEWAGTFDDVVMDRDSPRTDCPTTLPDLPDTERLQFEVESARELSDLQRSFMDLAAALVKDDSPRRKTLRTKAEGAEYVQNMMARFFAENSS